MTRDARSAAAAAARVPAMRRGPPDEGTRRPDPPRGVPADRAARPARDRDELLADQRAGERAARMTVDAQELVALLEVARLRAWLRALAELAGADALALVEHAIAADIWPAVDGGLPDGHGARRTGGSRSNI